VSDWVDITATLGLGVAGLYFGHSVRRKTQAEIEAHVAERRTPGLAPAFDALSRTLRAIGHPRSGSRSVAPHEVADSLSTRQPEAQGTGSVERRSGQHQ
jgi:hypothetical protein